MPTILDFSAVALFAVLLPAYGLFETWRHRDTSPDDDPTLLFRSYRATIILLWACCLFTLWVWTHEGRSFADLGFTVGSAGYGPWVWLVTFLVCGLLLWQAVRAGTNIDTAQSIMTSLEREDGVNDVMPRTPADYRLFKLVSLSAGITEEIMFRGFLIWFLTHWMPLWAAAVLSIIAFVLAHLYQKSVTALAQVAGIALALTLVYLLSGSLWLAILLHIVIDLTSNATIWRARRLTAAHAG